MTRHIKPTCDYFSIKPDRNAPFGAPGYNELLNKAMRAEANENENENTSVRG